MDLARDELLARPALPHDQDRRGRRRGPGDLGAQLLHRRALTHEDGLLVELLPQPLVLGDEAVARQGVLERDQDPLALRRLLQEVHGSPPRRLHRRGDVAMPGDHQDRRGRFALGDPVEDLQPVHAGHLDVEENRVDALRVEARESSLSVGRGQHLITLVLEDHPERIADARIIVNHQDPSSHRWRH